MLIAIILSLISGAGKGLADRLQFHIDTLRKSDGSIFFKNRQFWDPSVSWRNKWADGDREKGERFPGSSNFFVFTTDAWHLMQFIMINSLFLAILVYHPWIHWTLDFFICRLAFGLGFRFTYK